MKNSSRGFIALISTLVIGAILLLLVASVGTASFFARFDSLGNYQKRAALALADSCAQVALLALATSTDPESYAPVNQTVAVDAEDSCVIKNVVHDGSAATITAYASSDGSFASISVKAKLSPVTIVSWESQ